jgi:hypothetical protein
MAGRRPFIRWVYWCWIGRFHGFGAGRMPKQIMDDSRVMFTPAFSQNHATRSGE